MHSYSLKSKIKLTSSEYIPVEIESEILKRLPVKSLLRFRSVSKPWKRLIDNRDFIVSYGVRHPQPHRSILGCKKNLVAAREVDYENKYFTYFDDEHSFVQQKFGSEDPCVPDLLSRYEGYPRVVDSSHGLLCFHIIYHEYMSDSLPPLSREMVVLWNPSIRKSIRIQLPSIFFDLPDIGYGVVNAIGFGVCPVTFDPIILKIKWVSRHDISRPWEVRVFTLSTGTWNILSTNLPHESIELRGPQVVIDRFIYWVAFDRLVVEDGRSQSQFLIMSFDLIAKEFKEIKLTGCLSNRSCKIQTISKLHESLVILEYHREFEDEISVEYHREFEEDIALKYHRKFALKYHRKFALEYHKKFEEDVSVCCLWLMTEERGVNRSFTKLYNINMPHATIKTLLGFRKTGELILITEERHKEAELVIYDPNSEAIDNLQIRGKDNSFFMCSYMESLVLLGRLDGFIYQK